VLPSIAAACIVPVVRPGDAMPGGGRVVTAALQPGNFTINEREQVAFSARLDEDADGDGVADGGVYLWDGGTIRVVARSGDIAEDVGILQQFSPVLFGNDRPFSGAVVNDDGEVLFSATTRAGDQFLLEAPRPR
jgi:hypothetical protein